MDITEKLFSTPCRARLKVDFIFQYIQNRRKGYQRRRILSEKWIADGELSCITGEFEDLMLDLRSNLNWKEFHKVLNEIYYDGGMYKPRKRLQYFQFHFLNIPIVKLTSAEACQSFNLKLSRFVGLDSNVESGKRSQKCIAPIALIAPRREKSVEQIETDCNGMSGEIKVINDTVRPMANFFTPRIELMAIVIALFFLGGLHIHVVKIERHFLSFHRIDTIYQRRSS